MRPICWLHISDIHIRVSDAWSHDVVLKAMCEDIARRKKSGLTPDFILATVDLAFSGNVAEYKLVESFFDAISTASGVPKDRIFCIPGNHDIDRERQKMSFYGARHFAQSQNQIDSLLRLSSREKMEHAHKAAKQLPKASGIVSERPETRMDRRWPWIRLGCELR
jgi:predicted MPP superfamily phosphohydrolase